MSVEEKVGCFMVGIVTLIILVVAAVITVGILVLLHYGIL